MNISKCKNYFITNKFNRFNQLEVELSKIESTTYKGDLFEYFNYAYFCLNKDKYQIKDIYPYDDIPSTLKDKYNLKIVDYGFVWSEDKNYNMDNYNWFLLKKK